MTMRNFVMKPINFYSNIAEEETCRDMYASCARFFETVCMFSISGTLSENCTSIDSFFISCYLNRGCSLVGSPSLKYIQLEFTSLKFLFKNLTVEMCANRHICIMQESYLNLILVYVLLGLLINSLSSSFVIVIVRGPDFFYCSEWQTYFKTDNNISKVQ